MLALFWKKCCFIFFICNKTFTALLPNYPACVMILVFGGIKCVSFSIRFKCVHSDVDSSIALNLNAEHLDSEGKQLAISGFKYLHYSNAADTQDLTVNPNINLRTHMCHDCPLVETSQHIKTIQILCRLLHITGSLLGVSIRAAVH